MVSFSKNQANSKKKQQLCTYLLKNKIQTLNILSFII